MPRTRAATPMAWWRNTYAGAWAARFGEMLMPTVANGITARLEHRARPRREFRIRISPRTCCRSASRVVRALGFVNHANMGSYREAIDGYLSGQGRRSGRHALPQAGKREIRLRTEWRAGTDAAVAGLLARWDGTTAQRNRSPIRKSTGPPKSAAIFAASRGTGRRTKWARRSWPTGSPATTGAIWLWGAWDSSWATAA